MLRWLFVDMNSYFASAEQHDQPLLRDQPVAVVPVMSDYTCVIAASYEAKAFGIKTGMHVREAKEKLPGLLLIQARPKYYIQLHHQLIRASELEAPVEKVYSIDEWAVRLMGKEHEPEHAAALGQRIKDRIAVEVGPCLRCSVGIAPSRMLAKIASDLQKPDGLTVLTLRDMPDRLAHLELDDLTGIGKGMFTRLQRHGIKDVRSLWAISERQARDIWGSVEGARWWRAFHGFDDPEVPTHRSSMSHSNVLDPKLRSDAGAHGVMVRLIHKLGMRLRYHGYVAHALSAHVRYDSRRAWAQAIDLPGVQDTPTLLQHFERLWVVRPRQQGDRPRKIGVVVGGLIPQGQATGYLFADMERPLRLSRVMDTLNQRWGSHTVYFGGMHQARQSMDDKIAFGRIPDEVVGM